MMKASGRGAAENRICARDPTQEALSLDELCNVLSISRATARNWVRLGKIVPDIDDRRFSRAYVEELVTALRSDGSAKLKHRRNKKSVSGKALYRDYIQTAENQQVVAELLELGVVEDEKDLLIVLANFAVQLYYQRHQIPYSDGNILTEYVSASPTDDLSRLIRDLLGDCALEPARLRKLRPALTKELRYAEGEDTLGFVYLSMRDIGKRKRSGAYYTPGKVVDELIESLLERDPNLARRTFCDPCCGTGNFLLGLGAKGVAYTNIYGRDRDPVSVCLARINLALRDPGLSAAEICSRITVGNTLFETFPQTFDVVLGNPPWGCELSDEETAKCRELYRTAVEKRVESSDLFVEKALTMLKPNGVLAFVLPEAVLGVAAHDAVRRLILERCSFLFVSYLGNAFSGVQCPSVLLGITLDERHTLVGCKVTAGGNSFSIAQPRCFPDGILSLESSDEEYACLRAISGLESAAHLKGQARFGIGIVTGNNRAFLSDKKQADNEAVLRGGDIVRYGISAPESYLRFEPEAFQQAAPAELYRAKEKLLYRFICEVPVFAYDDQQRLSLNSCNIVIPEIEGLDMKYVLAILNSSVAAFFFSRRFRSVKLLRSHIEQMPIPVASRDAQDAIIEKVERIMTASENISGLYEALDKDVEELFGLTAEQIEIIHTALCGKNRFLKKEAKT